MPAHPISKALIAQSGVLIQILCTSWLNTSNNAVIGKRKTTFWDRI